MISFYTEEDPTTTMETKTDDTGSHSENGIQDTLKTVLVGIPGECPSEDGKPIDTLENFHDSSSFDTVEVSAHLSGNVQTNIHSSVNSHTTTIGSMSIHQVIPRNSLGHGACTEIQLNSEPVTTRI